MTMTMAVGYDYDDNYDYDDGYDDGYDVGNADYADRTDIRWFL